jgi:NPCBM/NEW2 domain
MERVNSSVRVLSCLVLLFSIAAYGSASSDFELQWNSKPLNSPGAAPGPLSLSGEVRVLRDGKTYSTSNGQLTLQTGDWIPLAKRIERKVLTLQAADGTFSASLRLTKHPAGPQAFASSMGGTQWRHDHESCGPQNAIDGDASTSWLAGRFQTRDAWLMLRFPDITPIDEIEVITLPTTVVSSWILLGEGKDGNETQLAAGKTLPSHLQIAINGQYKSLRLKLLESKSPPGITEIIPKYRGECLTSQKSGRVEIDAEISDGKGEIELLAVTNIEKPVLGSTHYEQAGDNKVLTMTSGYPTTSRPRTLFDRERDLALSFSAYDNGVQLEPAPDGYTIRSRVPSGQRLLGIDAHTYYFQSDLGVRFYRPIDKTDWPVAPSLAMTWYGIKAWESETSQNHERLDPQIEWVAKNLTPWGLSVFQLDDCYDRRDDKLMRSLSDKIRAEGMIPGIWFVPFSTAFPKHFKTHPDWFLHDAKGKRISTFTGHTYKDPSRSWDGPALNLSVSEAEAWYRDWWIKLNDTWNFDFFKIDGIPTTVNAYFKAADLDRNRFSDPMLGIQRGVEIGRQVVGATKFINLCWGMPVDAMGFANGSRTGQDSGGFQHNIRTVIEWQYLNNTAWYCDPDSLSYMHKKTVEHTRLRAQARSLTGQQFITDETWTLLPEPITHVLQKSIPMIDINPTNLYRIKDWANYEIFDLKISRPWGQWDVVGLFNYREEEKQQALDLSRLDLIPRSYHVWSFWDHQYLGQHAHDAKISLRPAKPLEGRVFSLVPADAGIQLLATDRHVTMGGLDLVKYGHKGHIVSGRSTHLVPGDPYRIIFYAPNREAKALACEDGSTITARYPGSQTEIVELVIVPKKTEVQWSANIVPTKRQRLQVSPMILNLGKVAADTKIDAYLLVSGVQDAAVSSAQPWLRVALEGHFHHVFIDTSTLASNTEAAGMIIVGAPGSISKRIEVPVTLRVGPRLPAKQSFDSLAEQHDALVISHVQGWGSIQKNLSVTGKPIILAGKTYQMGLGSHAAQRTQYFIGDKGYTHFAATVGLDATAAGSKGKVQVRVLVDGVQQYASPVLTSNSKPVEIIVDGLEKARTLTLIVDSMDNQDYDHVDWADVRLYK